HIHDRQHDHSATLDGHHDGGDDDHDQCNHHHDGGDHDYDTRNHHHDGGDDHHDPGNDDHDGRDDDHHPCDDDHHLNDHDHYEHDHYHPAAVLADRPGQPWDIGSVPVGDPAGDRSRRPQVLHHQRQRPHEAVRPLRRGRRLRHRFP